MLELGLFWIGVVLIVTAIFMLFLDSFQSKRTWAVISLVLIVPLFLHMLLNWSSLNVRKSFYLLIIGMLAVLVSVSGGVLSQLSFLQEHEVVQALEDKIAPPEDTPLSNQQQADTATLSVEDNYDPLLTGSEYEQLEVKEIVPEKINQVTHRAEPSGRYELITDDERIHAVNKRVRVIMIDARVVEGKLTEIIDDSIIVESEVNGGSLGLSYKNDQIQSVAVRLVEGEKLYVPEEPEQVTDVEPGIDQQETIIDTDTLLGNETQPILNDVDVSNIPTNKIELQSTSKALESLEPLSEIAPQESAVQNEVLEKIEEIVDDTKLLDNVNGQ
jgi:hypothetical protein